MCFPSIDYETDYGENVSVIHPEVYSKIEVEPKVKRWLENLGIKEPSDLAYIENEIIANIDEAINDSNYLNVTRSIFNLHKKGLLKDFHIEISKIKIINYQERIEITIKSLSDIYMPSLSLESINDGNFVSEEYKSLSDIVSELKTFLF